MTPDTTPAPQTTPRAVNDADELDAFLAAYTPSTLPQEHWRPLAAEAIALVKGAGPYTRPRVQNDISVLSLVLARLHERGRSLTLDEALADSTLLDFDLAQQRTGAADKTRVKARGILRRLQAAHNGVPWRRRRRDDGQRISKMQPPTLAGELARVVAEAERDNSSTPAAAFRSAVEGARLARRGVAQPPVTADAQSWRLVRAFAADHGWSLTAAGLTAAVTHEVLLLSAPLAELAATYALTRRDLDLALTHLADLPPSPSPEHRAALRGTGPARRGRDCCAQTTAHGPGPSCPG